MRVHHLRVGVYVQTVVILVSSTMINLVLQLGHNGNSPPTLGMPQHTL